MDKPMIGIRQADGSFYEIMGDAQTGRKRLVLSAARTDQHGVKIDLYRSVDGTLDEANSLGSISLDDPEGLGYKDIEFRVDLDAEGQLEASAALPGQPPRTLSVDLSPYQGPRTDAEILDNHSLSDDDLDTLDDEFSLDPEPMTLDLPEVDELLEVSDEPPPRTDVDILGDESLAATELDTLDDFSFEPDSEVESAPADLSLDDFGLETEVESLPEVEPVASEFDLSLPEEDAPSFAPDSFDLGDLDAGFGSDEPAEAEVPAAEPDEEWEKISLDDMESMEFMDTGDEISAPSKKTSSAQVSKAPPSAREDHDDFGFDDRQPLELSDLDSDLSDLPDLGDLGGTLDEPSGSLDDLDHDFLAPPALTEPSDWDLEPEPPSKPSKAPKPVKETKSRPTRTTASAEGSPGLDRTALFLSLFTLSLLVLLILVLLFLNMIKAPQPPVVQPEVMRWKPVAALASMPVPEVTVIDLASAPSFEAASVLEIPEPLRTARISLRLSPGETALDAERRFGVAARSQGNLLFW